MVPELVRAYNEHNPASTIKQVTNLRTLCEMMNDVASSKTTCSKVRTLLHTVLTVLSLHLQVKVPFASFENLKVNYDTTEIESCYAFAHIQDKLDLLSISTKVNDRRKSFFGSY